MSAADVPGRAFLTADVFTDQPFGGNPLAARAGIATLDDPAAELVLTRRCLDVAKVSYQLRCNGDCLSDDLLAKFDAD